MTAYPGIVPPLYSHDCLIALVLSLGMLWETVLGGMPLSPSMILVCRGQDCPWQRPLAVWTFFIRHQTYLPPRCGPWAWHEMGRGCQILWPHSILVANPCNAWELKLIMKLYNCINCSYLTWICVTIWWRSQSLKYSKIRRFIT